MCNNRYIFPSDSYDLGIVLTILELVQWILRAVYKELSSPPFFMGKKKEEKEEIEA